MVGLHLCNLWKKSCWKFDCIPLSLTFPPFLLGSESLQFVSQFRYLGHIINNRLTDDDDIMREVKNLFIRTNMLISRFKKCSTRVKVKLFRAYCLCIYDLALWHCYTSTAFNKLKLCYHKCIKKLFGFARMDSMTGILCDLNLPSFETIVHNCKYVFHSQAVSAPNRIVQHYISIGLVIWCWSVTILLLLILHSLQFNEFISLTLPYSTVIHFFLCLLLIIITFIIVVLNCFMPLFIFFSYLTVLVLVFCHATAMFLWT